MAPAWLKGLVALTALSAASAILLPPPISLGNGHDLQQASPETSQGAQATKTAKPVESVGHVKSVGYTRPTQKYKGGRPPMETQSPQDGLVHLAKPKSFETKIASKARAVSPAHKPKVTEAAPGPVSQSNPPKLNLKPATASAADPEDQPASAQVTSAAVSIQTADHERLSPPRGIKQTLVTGAADAIASVTDTPEPEITEAPEASEPEPTVEPVTVNESIQVIGSGKSKLALDAIKTLLTSAREKSKSEAAVATGVPTHEAEDEKEHGEHEERDADKDEEHE